MNIHCPNDQPFVGVHCPTPAPQVYAQMDALLAAGGKAKGPKTKAGKGSSSTAGGEPSEVQPALCMLYVTPEVSALKLIPNECNTSHGHRRGTTWDIHTRDIPSSKMLGLIYPLACSMSHLRLALLSSFSMDVLCLMGGTAWLHHCFPGPHGHT